MTIKFGIIGYGKMGKIRHKSIDQHSDTIVAAIFDTSFSEEEIANNELYISSVDEMLEKNIDAVVISTFVDAAPKYAVQALQAGIHVLSEKPPAKNASELMPVLKEERSSNKILKYCFNHRYHYSVIEAKKIIDSGAMGKLLWMRGVYGKAGSIDYHDSWRNYKKYSGGGILIDQGIHMLDLVQYLSGASIQCVHSVVSSSFWDVEAEDNAFITLKIGDSAFGTVHSSATQWRHKFLLEMEFEEGFVNLDGILSSTGSYAPEMLITGRREFEDVTFAMGKPKQEITCFENDASWGLELSEFVDAVNGKDVIKNGTSEDALSIIQLIDNIYRRKDGCS